MVSFQTHLDLHDNMFKLNLKTILLTKTTAAQSEDALSYYRVRGLYSLAVVFVRSIHILHYLVLIQELIMIDSDKRK